MNTELALLRGAPRLMFIRLSDWKLLWLPLRGVIGPTLTEAGLFYT